MCIHISIYNMWKTRETILQSIRNNNSLKKFHQKRTYVQDPGQRGEFQALFLHVMTIYNKVIKTHMHLQQVTNKKGDMEQCRRPVGGGHFSLPGARAHESTGGDTCFSL